MVGDCDIGAFKEVIGIGCFVERARWAMKECGVQGPRSRRV